jgi:hypothetical protein
MGKLWGPDAVSKHVSTSFYGNCVALAESPKKEGLLYVGTDDGLIQVTEDGGANWRKVEKFANVPERTYVSKLVASQHDVNTVYAAFDNHKNADFAPYLLKSTDAGKSWTSIVADLPARGTVYCLAEDHVDPGLLFCGTEFGLFVTLDGGKKWQRIRNGLPTIQVKDLCIQRKQNDLVVGTFGRGIYVIDDYSPLRKLKPDTVASDAALFPPRDAVLYVPSAQFGGAGKAFLGASFYTADNPAFGATFTYLLKEGLKTRKDRRKEAERAAERAGKPLPYPTPDELRAEAEEEAPSVFLQVADADGTVVRTVPGPTAAGLHRVTWDLRDPAAALTLPTGRRGPAADDDEFGGGPSGPLVAPGGYTVRLFKRVEGKVSEVAGPVEFNIVPDTLGSPNPDDVKEQVAFHRQVLKLQRALSGATNIANDLTTRLEAVRRALDTAPKADEPARTQARELIAKNRDILRALRGDTVLRGRNENVPTSISERVSYAGSASARYLGKPTGTQKEAYAIASKEFAAELAKLRQLAETDLPALEKKLEGFEAPVTPGRLPKWDGK